MNKRLSVENNEISIYGNANTNRWLYLVVGTIMLMFLGLLYAWSIFAKPFSSLFGTWSGANLSLTFTISMVFFCIGGFISGKLSKTTKPSSRIRVSAILLLVGFFGLSRLSIENQSTSLKMLYFFYGILCGSGVGVGYNSILGSVNKWFADRVGFASGVLLMGFGFGGLILGSIVNELIVWFGLFKTFEIVAITTFVIIMIGASIIRNPDVLEGDIHKPIKDKNHFTSKDFNSSEMIKTKSFWIFFLWAIMVSSSGLLVINSAASIAEAFGAPAVLGLLVSVSNGFGRVFFGQTFDKHGFNKSMILNNIILAIAGIILLLGSVYKSILLVIAGLLLVGLSYGGAPSLASSVIHLFFGSKNYPINFSITNFSLIPAAFMGPMVSNYLIESSNGSYNLTFIMIIVLAILSFSLKILLSISIKDLKRG